MTGQKPELLKLLKDKWHGGGVLVGGVLEKEWVIETVDVHFIFKSFYLKMPILNPGSKCSLL